MLNRAEEVAYKSTIKTFKMRILILFIFSVLSNNLFSQNDTIHSCFYIREIDRIEGVSIYKFECDTTLVSVMVVDSLKGTNCNYKSIPYNTKLMLTARITTRFQYAKNSYMVVYGGLSTEDGEMLIDFHEEIMVWDMSLSPCFYKIE